MHKIIIAVLVVLSSVSCSAVYANPEAVLRKYIQQHFAAPITLNPQQITQLTWVMQHSRQSNDMDSKVAANIMHIEIARSLTRLYCMQLLKIGTQAAYQEFIRAQLLDQNILSFESFAKLSKYIQILCAEDYELLQDATILQAISLTDQAERLARDLLQQNELNDNLDFLAKTLRVDPKIYPLAQRYTNDRAAAKKLLYVLFPPQTNFRHMLYTEGGISMFNYLRVMIQHQYVNQDDLDLWYAYWIVNIAGFRGHVNQQGSVYLTEPVFQAMQALKQNIDLMLYTPNYNPLLPYLEYRAKILGLQHLPQEQQLLLAHMGSMLRMYTATDGALLEDVFVALPTEQQRTIANFFRKGLNFNDRHVTTHFPALFANTLELVQGDKTKAIKTALPIYSQAVFLYNKKMRAGELHPDLALNFNYLSATKNLRHVMNLGANGLQQLCINVSGEVVLHRNGTSL